MFLAINERLTNDKLLINNSYGTMKIRKIKKNLWVHIQKITYFIKPNHHSNEILRRGEIFAHSQHIPVRVRQTSSINQTASLYCCRFFGQLVVPPAEGGKKWGNWVLVNGCSWGFRTSSGSYQQMIEIPGQSADCLRAVEIRRAWTLRLQSSDSGKHFSSPLRFPQSPWSLISAFCGAENKIALTLENAFLRIGTPVYFFFSSLGCFPWGKEKFWPWEGNG